MISLLAAHLTLSSCAEDAPSESAGADVSAAAPTPEVGALLAYDREAPGLIHVAEGHVYWAEGTSLFRVETAGGDVESMATGDELVAGMTVYNGTLFWAGAPEGAPGRGVIRSRGVNSAATQLLAADQIEPRAIAAGPNGVYWALHTGEGLGAIMERRPTGTVVTFQDVVAEDLAIDDTHLYWADGGFIYHAPLAGGAAEVLSPGQPGVNALTLAPSRIFYASTATDGAVYRVPRVGGGSTGIATQVRDPRQVTLLGADVWFLLGGDKPGLARVPQDGGQYTEVALPGTSIEALATDGSALYWTERSEGRIIRYEPPEAR